ncbi:MAG TPA: hypothetical protein VGL10_03440 [Gammaproteobacteria bacterium]
MKNAFIWSACLLVTILTGCGARDEADYCSAHENFHPEHQDKVAKLNVRYGNDGVVDAVLEANHAVLRAAEDPAAVDTAAGILGDVNRVFMVTATNACELTLSTVEKQTDKLQAHYVFNCGDSNRLENVDIKLLEHLPLIDELEADIETSAVRKTFLISRQCKKPIFNYQNLSQN